jgi:hypothetical protein
VTALIDGRPGGLDALFRPGNTFAVALTWPAGSLVGRTFTATLDAASLNVAVVGNVMTITVTEAQTAAADERNTFTLTETTGGPTQDLIVGSWKTSTQAGTPTSAAATVVLNDSDVAVAVTVVSTDSQMESLGAVVDQAAARTLEGRWLQFIRDSSGSASLNYLGGDVSDCVSISGGGDTLWIGADWFDGTTIDSDDTYNANALPVRNGAVLATTPGTFAGASQLYQSGTSGIWLNAQSQGGLPVDTLWWPIVGLDDGGTVRVMCHHISDAAPRPPWGKHLDSHLVTLNAFGGYASHIATGLGASDIFWVDGLLRDTTHTYIYGQQFVPDIDADINNNGSVPNYGIGDVKNHYTLKRVARVTNGSLTTVASWQFWNGTTWVSGVTNATPVVDASGAQIRGDGGVRKIVDGHYVMAVHQLTDSHLNVYNATVPQGPWTRIARVPLPTQGHTINGGLQIGQITKILPTTEHPAGTPAEHSIAMLCRNLLNPTDAMSVRNIRRYTNQFAVIPNY